MIKLKSDCDQRFVISVKPGHQYYAVIFNILTRIGNTKISV